MKKPAHQWETARAVAHRIAPFEDPRLACDARAERFELRFHDGRVGYASFGLEAQWVDEVAATDPDVAHAAKAWLVARGQRVLRLSRDGAQLASAEPFAVDSLGELRVGRAPERLITLCPSNAELVDALGCFDRVVACDVSSDYPPSAASVERLGHDLAPDLARIAELAPDLVIASLTVPGMERVVTGLRARGIPQLVLGPRSLADVMDNATLLAEALGVPERGAALIERLEAERRQLASDASGAPARRVYLEWWPKPMFTPGRDCYSNELIALAGGVNVFGTRAGSSIRIEARELAEADPEVCFVSWCGVRADKLDPNNLIKREGLEGLRAAREGRVYPLDEAFSGRPGPRMLEAARIMARALRDGW